MGYEKLLLKASEDVTPNVRLYVRLSDNLDDFIEYLCKKAGWNIDVQWEIRFVS